MANMAKLAKLAMGLARDTNGLARCDRHAAHCSDPGRSARAERTNRAADAGGMISEHYMNAIAAEQTFRPSA